MATRILVYSTGTILFFLLVIIPVLHAYISQNSPVQSKTLVVQGWLFDTMMDQAVSEFRKGNYQQIIVTGIKKYAYSGTKRLIERGIPPSQIITAAGKCPNHKHKTFYEAIGLKNTLQKTLPDIKSMNIITSTVHGKKTHIAFRRVLGKKYRVGVITCPASHYNDKIVSISPHGIKVTLQFFIGYLYASIWKIPSAESDTATERCD